MESAADDYLKVTFSLTFSLNTKTEFVSLYVPTCMDDELDFFFLWCKLDLYFIVRYTLSPTSCFLLLSPSYFFKAFVTIQDAQLKINYAT